MIETSHERESDKVISLGTERTDSSTGRSSVVSDDRRLVRRVKSTPKSSVYSGKIVALLYALIALVVLFSANFLVAGLSDADRTGLNLSALVSGISAVGIMLFPWHRFSRNLLCVPFLIISGFIGVMVHLSGGWNSPFLSFYFLVASLCVMYLAAKLAALCVGLTLLISLGPQLYAPDASLLVKHLLIWVPVILILSYVVWYAANYWIPAEYDVKLQRARELKSRFEREAYTDRLTNISNRAYFEDRLDEEIKRIRRLGGDLALIFMDADDLKQVNDTYGHQTGDKALRLVARVLRRNARQIDVVARYGGDEFVVLMPGTSLSGARNFFERIQKEIAERSKLILGFTVCLSAGTITSSRNPSDYQSLLKAADDAMYLAKRQGKNRLSSANSFDYEESEVNNDGTS